MTESFDYSCHKQRIAQLQQKFKAITLVGNPNTGKTTLFNTLTGANEHVGNWHGVTVETHSRFVKNTNYTITDVPGIYSLNPYSSEEKVAVDYLMSHKEDLIINTCDINNLAHNLFLTLELMKESFRVVLVLNMAQEYPNAELLAIRLSKKLNISVIPIDARSSKGVADLLGYLNSNMNCENINISRIEQNGKFEKPNKKMGECARCRNCSIKQKLTNSQTKPIRTQTKLTNPRSEYLSEKKDLKNEKKSINNNEADYKYYCGRQYKRISELLNNINYNNQKTANSNVKIYFYNKFLFYMLIFAVFASVFTLVFGNFGKGLSSILSGFFNSLASLVVDKININSVFLRSLLLDGFATGVVNILSFLPQIVLLFLFINILEDIGLLARVAFMLDGALSRIGLTGKAVFSLLMGFGCTTSAIIATRGLDDIKLRRRVMLGLPNISCSAKLPIISCICGAFFGGIEIAVIIGLYVLGLIVAVAIYNKVNRIYPSSASDALVIEVPKIRAPRLKKSLLDAIKSAKDFIARVGSTIIIMSLVIWFLSNITPQFRFELHSTQSILNVFGNLISPIFAPLGFGMPAVAVALLFGLVAKEMVVGALSLANGVGSIAALTSSLFLATSAAHFTPASALSFLVFILFYPSCVSAFSAMTGEFGIKFALLSFCLQFGIAYVLSFITYSILSEQNIAFAVMLIVAFLIANIMRFMIKFKKRDINGTFQRNRCGEGKTFEVDYR